MSQSSLPQQIRRLTPGESFRFRCHPGVACFNECCRELELALTPYDVLNLKQALGLRSDLFLEQYAVIETTAGQVPRVYLGMRDDGRASCPFVAPQGCSVYHHRPGACRTYPIGRGAFQIASGEIKEIHVLLSEPHCQGFAEDQHQEVPSWEEEQGLAPFKRYNDKLIAILQHQRIKAGMQLTAEQQRLFLLALYDLDAFRDYLRQHDPTALAAVSGGNSPRDAEIALLEQGITWLANELFPE